MNRFIRRTFSRRLLIRVAVGVTGTILGLLLVIWLGQLGVYNLSFAEVIYPSLVSGFYLTTELVATVIPLGFAIGFLVGWARTTRSRWLRGFGSLYVDFFRSLPPLVLIFFAFLIGLLELKNIGEDFAVAKTLALWFGVVALGFHTAAYQAEIVRAGILSVPLGQTEAADAIGMSRWRSMFLVVFPQAFRVSLPALGNEFSSVIKDTSLLSAIGWFELSGTAGVQVEAGLLSYHYLFAGLVVWFEVAAFYFLVTFILNSVVRALENVSKVPGLEAPQL
jgi:His/Glu/Gln/Arg/opine family amino acid ABC transporter permease subunit